MYFLCVKIKYNTTNTPCTPLTRYPAAFNAAAVVVTVVAPNSCVHSAVVGR